MPVLLIQTAVIPQFTKQLHEKGHAPVFRNHPVAIVKFADQLQTLLQLIQPHVIAQEDGLYQCRVRLVVVVKRMVVFLIDPVVDDHRILFEIVQVTGKCSCFISKFKI